MKKKIIGFYILFFAALFPAAGQSPAAASERAAAARQLGLDFLAPGYFQSEWESADALYNAAAQADAGSSEPLFNAAAEALEAVAEKAIAHYAEDQEAVLEDARERAVRAGAQKEAEDYLLMADNKAAEILPPYEANDYYAARDKLFEAVQAYGALETGLNAYNLRMKLDERDFARYDPETLEAADELGFSAIEDYENGNIADAGGKAEDVLEQYIEFEAAHLAVYAVEASENAAAERQRALDARANITARFEFEAGEGFYSRAQDSADDEDITGAADLFDRAIAQFSGAYALTVQRRMLAEEALKEVDLRLAESELNARRAEEIIEGGIQ